MFMGARMVCQTAAPTGGLENGDVKNTPKAGNEEVDPADVLVAEDAITFGWLSGGEHIDNDAYVKILEKGLDERVSGSVLEGTDEAAELKQVFDESFLFLVHVLNAKPDINIKTNLNKKMSADKGLIKVFLKALNDGLSGKEIKQKLVDYVDKQGDIYGREFPVEEREMAYPNSVFSDREVDAKKAVTLGWLSKGREGDIVYSDYIRKLEKGLSNKDISTVLQNTNGANALRKAFDGSFPFLVDVLNSEPVSKSRRNIDRKITADEGLIQVFIKALGEGLSGINIKVRLDKYIKSQGDLYSREYLLDKRRTSYSEVKLDAGEIKQANMDKVSEINDIEDDLKKKGEEALKSLLDKFLGDETFTGDDRPAWAKLKEKYLGEYLKDLTGLSAAFRDFYALDTKQSPEDFAVKADKIKKEFLSKWGDGKVVTKEALYKEFAKDAELLTVLREFAEGERKKVADENARQEMARVDNIEKAKRLRFNKRKFEKALYTAFTDESNHEFFDLIMLELGVNKMSDVTEAKFKKWLRTQNVRTLFTVGKKHLRENADYLCALDTPILFIADAALSENISNVSKTSRREKKINKKFDNLAVDARKAKQDKHDNDERILAPKRRQKAEKESKINARRVKEQARENVKKYIYTKEVPNEKEPLKEWGQDVISYEEEIVFKKFIKSNPTIKRYLAVSDRNSLYRTLLKRWRKSKSYKDMMNSLNINIASGVKNKISVRLIQKDAVRLIKDNNPKLESFLEDWTPLLESWVNFYEKPYLTTGSDPDGVKIRAQKKMLEYIKYTGDPRDFKAIDALFEGHYVNEKK